MIEFFLEATPRSKGNSKTVRRYGKRLVPVASDEEVAAERVLVMLAYRHAPVAKIEGPIRLDVTFVMPIPESWSIKKKASAFRGEILPTSRPDRGNMLKLLEDVLEDAGFYANDAAVVSGEVAKVYGAKPGYKVRLSPAVIGRVVTEPELPL